MSLGLRGRLVSTYLLVMLLGVGSLVLRFGLLSEAQIIEEAEHELEIQAFVLVTTLGDSMENLLEGETSSATFERSIARLSKNVPTEINVLNAQGNVLYSTIHKAQTLGNQAAAPEIQQALQGGEKHAIRPDPLTGEEKLYVAAPIYHDSQVAGVMQLANPIAPIQRKINQTWFTLIGTALVIFVAVIIASLWLANYILRPLKTMQQAAVKLAAGDLDQQLTISGNDELSDLAQAFNHMVTQLKTTLEQQRQFVSNASHELRTPLTNIKLRAESMLNGAREDPAVAEKFLVDIEREADHMAYLTKTLLSLSKLDANHNLTDLTLLKLFPFLSEIVHAFQPLAEDKAIDLCLDLPPALPTIEANRDQLRQVLDNLLSNALKYSPTGQRVTLTAQSTPQTITVTLSDTGPGIPPTDLPHIFERFYRVDKARTRTQDPGGSGLGLAIVKEIVDLHQGQISVESEVGVGTKVVLVLPLAHQRT